MSGLNKYQRIEDGRYAADFRIIGSMIPFNCCRTWPKQDWVDNDSGACDTVEMLRWVFEKEMQSHFDWHAKLPLEWRVGDNE